MGQLRMYRKLGLIEGTIVNKPKRKKNRFLQQVERLASL